jgi:hypothetical protein
LIPGNLGGKVRELRFHLLRQQTWVTCWLAGDLTDGIFPKPRSAQTAEVARALHAQRFCEAELAAIRAHCGKPWFDGDPGSFIIRLKDSGEAENPSATPDSQNSA